MRASLLCGPDLRLPDALTLVRLLLLAPLLEEWVLRAGVQEFLSSREQACSHRGAAIALVVPATLFSALHIREGWLIALMIFVPGLLLGLLYQRTRNWVACASAHALFNFLALAFCRA